MVEIIKSLNINSNIFLIKKNPADTPWTTSSIVGAPENLVYNGKETVLVGVCSKKLAETMNARDLPFQYDHAVAIME
jgi:hypothetical protein